MEPLNQRQGFLVSAIVHLTLLMILLSRPPAGKVEPTEVPAASQQTARVFVPPAETLRRVLPPTALRRPAPVPTPPPPPPTAPKDRISIGPPLPRQEGPLILRKEDDLTKAPKGRPDAVPSPSAPVPPPAPTPAPVQAADAGSQEKAPGTEGLRLPPGIGRELPRGAEGSKGTKSPTDRSIASTLQNLDSRLQSTDTIGIPSGTGQWIHGLMYDPMGADFTEWINHFKNEWYRNFVYPPSAQFMARGYTEVQLVVERDGTLSVNQLTTSCGNVALDRASRNGFTSSRLLPLPSDYHPANFPIRVRIIWGPSEAPSGS